MSLLDGFFSDYANETIFSRIIDGISFFLKNLDSYENQNLIVADLAINSYRPTLIYNWNSLNGWSTIIFILKIYYDLNLTLKLPLTLTLGLTIYSLCGNWTDNTNYQEGLSTLFDIPEIHHNKILQISSFCAGTSSGLYY